MPQISQKSIEKALSTVIDTETDQNIIVAGYVKHIAIDGAVVGCILDLGHRDAHNKEPMRAEAEKAIMHIEGVKEASVIMTSERPVKDVRTPKAPPAGKPGINHTPPPPTGCALPGVKSIIAVASGKGGVGKSTTSVNLALSLKKLGLSVGIVDLDIFGPSLPKLTGTEGQRPALDKENKIVPIEAMGIKILSIGLMINNDEPVVWRGPRVMGATQQMLKDTAWGPLDVLVIDLPPGTGDVQLSMVQTVTLTGAVIVSTPQDLALIDARKGLMMFEKTNVPVLGIIENMSTFICPKCGEESHIFGHGGAKETAKILGTDFLGDIPLDMDIRILADAGTPIVTLKPESEQAMAYLALAKKIAAKLPV